MADELLRSLGVVPEALATTCAKPYSYDPVKLGREIFFDRETFGADRLATGVGTRSWSAVLHGTPLGERVLRDIARIYGARTDSMPGLTSTEKKQRFSTMSHVDVLSKVAPVDPSAIPHFQATRSDERGVGCDAVSALDVWTSDFLGYRHELGQARFGWISIANSESGAAAYADSAIDQVGLRCRSA